MALSDSYSFSVTATDIVRTAMLYIGALGEAETPTAQEYTDCLRVLNMMAKQWMARQDFAPGLKMWERSRGDLFLSSSKGQYLLGNTTGSDNWAGGVASSTTANFATSELAATADSGASTLDVGTTDIANFTVGDYVVVQLDSGGIYSSTVGTIDSGAGTFTLGNSNTLPSQASANAYVWNYTTRAQRPLAILTAVLRDSNQFDTPLRFMTLQDYERLPTKTATAYLQDPTALYYESQFGSNLNTPEINGPGVLYLDCGACQDVTKTIHVVYLRPIMDLVNATDNPDYPQQYYDALCWGLSRRICPMFDAEWTREMDLNYQEATGLARQQDPETTTLYFVADEDVP